VSYDIYLRGEVCPHCGRLPEEPDLPNPTYNLTPIFDFALTAEALPNPGTPEGAVVVLNQKTDRPRGLRVLSGLKAKDTVHWLRLALERLNCSDLHSVFSSLEPPNGWGNLTDADSTIRTMLAVAQNYPDNTWEIR
jgi:hypothetical protein